MPGSIQIDWFLIRIPSIKRVLAIVVTGAVAAGLVFLAYLPFTQMMHFVAKYFTYHEVRWDDKPVIAGDALDRKLDAARHFGIDWSAYHVRTGKTWVDVVTTLPKTDKAGE